MENKDNFGGLKKEDFVNLHGHSCMSLFDGYGFPQEHMDFAFDNGSRALALTDHGSMNGLSYQLLRAKEMKKEGKDFKPIFGVEAYYIDSLEEWQSLRDELASDEKNAKEVDAGDSAMVIEDEQRDDKRALGRKRHLVLLAQNQKGLENIYEMVSKSYSGDYFYRKPRIDFDLLKQHSEGVIVLTACLTGDSVVDTSIGQIRLDDLVKRWKRGEDIKILSYDEKTQKLTYQKVIWGDMTRKDAKIIQIKTKDGKQVRLTPDHKVFTDKGWIEAGELKKHVGIKILRLK